MPGYLLLGSPLWLAVKFPKLNLEEIYVGFSLQFLLYFVIHWWVLPLQVVCGILWALGGAEDGQKLFRRIGTPTLVCLFTFLSLHQWQIFGAVPLMIWGCPFSYGETSKLFIFFKKRTDSQKKADFYTRGVLYLWYYTVYGIFLTFK